MYAIRSYYVFTFISKILYINRKLLSFQKILYLKHKKEFCDSLAIQRSVITSYSIHYTKLYDGMDLEKVGQISASKRCSVKEFMDSLRSFDLLDVPLEGSRTEGKKYNERVYEKYLDFIHTFKNEQISYKEWLYFWSYNFV